MPKKSGPEKFKLVLKDEFKGILRTLRLPASTRAEVSLVGKTVLIEIRLPRARSCFPFSGNCIGVRFFDKVIRSARRPAR